MTLSPFIENKTLKKWLKIMPIFENYMKNNKKKLKMKIRKGIPDSLRGEVWLKISGVEKLRVGNENLYKDLIKSINEDENIVIPDEEVIIKDMHRTYPGSLLFAKRLGEGQRTLFRTLSCYSIQNKKIGYVQGMGFLIAIFLSYLTEENAFWMMESIMKNYNLQELYYLGFPGLKKELFVFLKLMQKLLPNIFRHFSKYKIYPTIYASSWYLTIFTNALSYDIVLRIMDCFLFEGKKILHRISLAILALKENEILSKKNLAEIMNVMKNIEENIDLDLLFKKGFDFSISRKQILKYEKLYNDYQKRIKTGDEDILIQVKME